MRNLRLILISIVSLSILSIAAFLLWALCIPDPMPEALAVIGNGNVQTDSHGWLIATPDDNSSGIGLIFLTGARVDHRAYAPAAIEIAKHGFLVVIPPATLNLSIFTPNIPIEIQRAFPRTKTWVVGGHSMGGAVAAQFAAANPDKVSGLVLWAAYPAGGNNLASSSIPVLSVFGSSDGVATPDEIERSKKQLPADTRFVEVVGGNHAQFGWYGNQSGDKTATIGRLEQQRQAVAATVELLNQLPNAPVSSRP